MKTIVNIYGLVNPINNRVFYIGATTYPLENRLKQHVWSLRGIMYHKSGNVLKRKELLGKLENAGLTFRIKLLETTEFRNATVCEKKWYSFYLAKNFNLLQKNTGDYKKQFNRSCNLNYLTLIK